MMNPAILKLVKQYIIFTLLQAAANAELPQIMLKYDQPSLQIPVSYTATVQCCYSCDSQVKPNVKWIVTTLKNKTSEQITQRTANTTEKKQDDEMCSILKVEAVTLEDTGLYRCSLELASHTIFTPGTFIQVYGEYNLGIRLFCLCTHAQPKFTHYYIGKDVYINS